MIVASLATGGAYYGVTRLFRSYSASRVEVIPKFINTPLDVLGASIFDMIGALSVKIALMDGSVTDFERDAIKSAFIKDWGFDATFVQRALTVLEENAVQSSLAEMIDSLSQFTRSNPDCNFSAMRLELVGFPNEVAHADGRLDEREEMAIDRVDELLRKADAAFSDADPSAFVKKAIAGPSRALSWLKRSAK